MKNLEELDFYELLDLETDADSVEITRAYRTACQTYSAESLAIYSVLSEQERERLLARITQAYAVLTDRERRNAYDRQLGLSENAAQAALEVASNAKRESQNKPSGSVWGKVKEVLPAHGRLTETVSRVLKSRRPGKPEANLSISSGRYLESIRRLKGLSLEEISANTRIKVRYLEALENEDYKKMPSGAYRRYILKALAEAIDLDPQAVVDDFRRRVSH